MFFKLGIFDIFKLPGPSRMDTLQPVKDDWLLSRSVLHLFARSMHNHVQGTLPPSDSNPLLLIRILMELNLAYFFREDEKIMDYQPQVDGAQGMSVPLFMWLDARERGGSLLSSRFKKAASNVVSTVLLRCQRRQPAELFGECMTTLSSVALAAPVLRP